jgi:hypothetical protein
VVEVMHKVLLEATKAAFATTSFITVNANEVTIIDNIQWLSIHLYMVQQWKRIPILLYMEIVRIYFCHFQQHICFYVEMFA